MTYICNNQTYCKNLLQLLNNQKELIDKDSESLLKINIYLSLLSLNNNNYCDEIYQKEYQIINLFLRKINNLKVKIQLKRKEREIDKLINEIIEMYLNNTKKIDKYNKCNFNIEKIIKGKDIKEITELLDSMTKIKFKKENNLFEYNLKRKEISNIIFFSEYYIEKDILYIIGKDRCIKLLIDDFYDIYEYLLDIDNYNKIFMNENYNNERKILIESLINSIGNLDSMTNKEIITIIMTYLISKDVSVLENINMSNFIINNIKITDLYSFANNKDSDAINHAKWNKIIIPNEYLYNKLNELLQKGMYYYNNDEFIIENINNKTNDFKISITVDNMILFLKNIISSFLSLYQN
ncbi:MAG: hypothetical protein IJZ79_06315 [Bacilli bacterium]|nr:hypothetical protein [Bacilli bacterium]